jgi:putative ABC transport system permease protein
MAPWWRGPVLLLRRAGVALALAAAALVATLPAGAAVPFLDSARSATLHHQTAADCATSAGLNTATDLRFWPIFTDQDQYVMSTDHNPGGAATHARQARRVSQLATGISGLGAPIDTVSGLLHAVGGQRTDVFSIQAMARPGYQQQVTVLAGPDGTGAWISSSYAKEFGLRPGDQLTITAATLPRTLIGYGVRPQPAHIRVAAIYQDLASEPGRTWWCGVRTLFDPPVEAEGGTPPLVLFDQADLLKINETVWGTATHYIQYPLADPRQTITTAHRLADQLRPITASLPGDPDFNTHQYDVPSRATASSDLVTFTQRAELARQGMRPTVLPVTAIGVLVGLLVAAAAAVFWVQRRRRELTVLSAHGVGARALGLKAVTEALPALVIGAAAGWGLAWSLVAWAGPDPVLGADSRPRSLLYALAALAASVIVVGAVAALASRSLTDTVRAHHRTFLAALPWELLLLAAAYPLWNALGGARTTTNASLTSGEVAHVPGRLLIVPMLVVAGLTALVARLAALWLRRAARRRTPDGVGAFLGWRRLGRQAVMSVLLASAVAVPIALAAYGAAVTGSVRATIEGEAKLRVGSDVVITLTEPAPLPAAFAGHGTVVLRLDGTLIGGVSTNLLAVDPDTFAQGAFWARSVTGDSMPELIGRLRSGPTGLLATAPVPAGAQPTSYGGEDILGGSTEVAQLRALPVTGAYPSAIVLRGDLDERAARSGVTQLWVRGDPAQIHRQALAAHLPIAYIRVATDLYANTLWEPLTYTFAYLTALSLLTGVVTVVGLLLYLEAQAPGHRRSYVLLRRMGMRVRSHRRALLGEIGYPLVAGLLVGVALAAGLTWLFSPDIEMNPQIPPETIVAWPTTPIGLIAVAVLLAALGATGYAQYRIGRAHPSEVLRDTVG